MCEWFRDTLCEWFRDTLRRLLGVYKKQIGAPRTTTMYLAPAALGQSLYQQCVLKARGENPCSASKSFVYACVCGVCARALAVDSVHDRNHTNARRLRNEEFLNLIRNSLFRNPPFTAPKDTHMPALIVGDKPTDGSSDVSCFCISDPC